MAVLERTARKCRNRKDCQEVLVVSVKRFGRIGGPKRTARWFFRSPCASRAGPRGLSFGGPEDSQEESSFNEQRVGRIGGPRKDCQEELIVSVRWVGRIGGPKRTARWFSVVRVPVVRAHGACHLAVQRTGTQCQQSSPRGLGELAVLARTARKCQ
eukprot:SAG11_NODE_4908_length_1726_cov_4.207130_3_plen_156_part_00